MDEQCHARVDGHPVKDKEDMTKGLDSRLRGNDDRVHRPLPPETGGPKGPEPTRYGDWEIAGKCVDF